MRILRLFSLLIPMFGTQAADTSLQAALAQMDAAAPKFRGLRADVRRITHTEIVHDDEIETGKIAVRRQSPKDLRMKIELQVPNPRTVWFLGNKVQIYYPKNNLAQDVGLGKANALKDQFLALGFGNTSKDLNASYTLQPGGPEDVAGQKAIRIVLIPKDQKMRSLFPKIELWLSNDGVALQQKLYEPGGDFITATYTKIEQTNVTDADVKVDIPKNAHWEKPLQ